MSFRLPLTRAQFADALAKGHGRALLHARKHGLYEDVFLAACLHDPTYDRQVEGSRLPWFAEFFEGAPAWLAVPVLTGLRTLPREERADLCELALLLAGRGCPDVVPALRAAFHYENGLAQSQLLELEGDEGFFWMAAHLGRLARSGRDVEASLVDRFAQRMPGATLREQRESVASMLRASTDPDVRYYAEWLETNGYARSLGIRVKGPPTPPPPKSADEVLSVLNELERDVYYFPGWAYQTDVEQLRVMARELYQPMPLFRLRSLLRCFQGSGLPDWDPRILEYADHENPEVRRITYWILAHHDEPEVRALALSRLAGASKSSSGNESQANAQSDQTSSGPSGSSAAGPLQRGGTAHGARSLGPLQPPPVDEHLSLAPRPVVPGTLEDNALRLFRATWRPGDERLLLRALRDVPTWDPDPRHTALSDLLEVLQDNPTPAARSLLLLLYEHTPCTNCRGDAVKLMLELGLLPAWARRECRHDADELIRATVS